MDLNETPFLAASYFIDSENNLIQAYLHKILQNTSEDPKDQAIAIYLAVRDDFFYDPFNIRTSPESLRASEVFKAKRGHCIDKALLYITLCRAQGIPARLGLAKVRNHMGTSKLEEIIKSDVLVPHGYAEVLLNGRWVKCTPAFNQQLCEKLGVPVLEFDGENDSVFQAYDREGGGFMEYLEDYGTFHDLPLGFIIELLYKNYPHLFNEAGEFIVSTK